MIRKLFVITACLLLLSASAFTQNGRVTQPQLRVTEIDGFPDVPVKQIVVQNGSLSGSNGVATLTYVSSFNMRSGAVTLSSSDVTTALGFTPENSSTSHVNTFNTRSGVVTLTSSDVTTALGFTPENSGNKNQASGYAGLSASSKLTQSQLPNLADRHAIDIGATSGIVPGVVEVNSTSTGTDANTTEKTLWSYTLPANTLNANNRAVRIKVFGLYAANANTKTVTLKVGSNTINAESGTTNNAGWQINALIIRTAASGSPSCIVFRDRQGGSIVTSLPTTFNLDWSLAQTFSLTAQNGTASANDVVFKGAVVEVLN